MEVKEERIRELEYKSVELSKLKKREKKDFRKFTTPEACGIVKCQMSNVQASRDSAIPFLGITQAK